MPSVNQLLADKALSHAVDMQQYSNGVVRRMMNVLNRSDKRLTLELALALERLDPASFTVERLQALLYSVANVNREAYAQMGKELTDELKDFVKYELQYQAQVLLSVLPVQISVATVSAEAVYAAALTRPFQGVILKGVLDDLEASKARRIRQTIAQGFTESKTTNEIIRELTETKFEVDRRDIEAVTRTALGHMAGFAQDRFVEANRNLIKAVVWHSTLDLRTSQICRIRDKKQYTPVTHNPIGHGVPWLSGPGRAHWRCRSYQTTILKNNKELGIDSPDIVTRNGERASMDGKLPADTTYGQWLQEQSKERQIEQLGPTRAKLMRDGKLSMDDMYSSKGVFLTLDELRARDANAFKRAGL
jgi:hypothetical protein